MLLPAARSFPWILPGRALRLFFYYALLGIFLWFTFHPLFMAYTLRKVAQADGHIAWMLFSQSFVLLAFLLEAAVVYVTDRSLARASLVRLLCFNPSHEADLFYWNLYCSFIFLGVYDAAAPRSVFPLLDLSYIPLPLGAILYIVIVSLSSFLIHFLSHKIPALWELHKIHHSATELTMTTGSREHLFTLFANSLAMASFYRTEVVGQMEAMAAVFSLTAFFSLFQHSSVNSRLGWLGYLFISPHAHRIHHLKSAEYHDKNFGNFLTIWDWLFGTFLYEVPLSGREMDREFGLSPGEAGPDPEGQVLPELFASTRRALASAFAGRRVRSG